MGSGTWQSSERSAGWTDEPRMDKRDWEFLTSAIPAVLAPYREQPDKYIMTTDHFDGRVTVTRAYFAQLDEAAPDRAYIDVKFGYRD
jgi:hypothetical protein